jgi:hypothetical protein
MRSSNAIFAMAFGLAGTGCSLVQPHVSLDAMERRTQEEGNLSIDIDSSGALTYAKYTRESFDLRRRTILRTEAGTLMALVPMAGYVGYNAARGHAGTELGRISAFGFTGLTLSQMLVQHGRIQVFTEASTKITCAIGVYRLAASQAGAYDVEIAELRAELTAIRSELTSAQLTDAEEHYRQALDASITDVAGALRNRTATEVLDAMLVNAVDGIVSAADRELDATTPSIATVLPHLAPFRLAGAKPDVAASDVGVEAAADASKPAIIASLEHRLALVSARVEKLPTLQEITPDFTACKYTSTNAAYAAPQAPFALGPGDSDHKSTKVVKAGTAATITITGGQPKYSCSVPGAAAAEITITEVASSPVGIFEIATTDKTPRATYTVLVIDAQGLTKQMSIQVTD